MVAMNILDQSLIVGTAVSGVGAFISVQTEAYGPLISSSDLVGVQALTVLLVFQLILLVGLRWGRNSVVLYLAAALTTGLFFGLSAPQFVNREFGGVESEGPDLEVVHWNKDGPAPMLRLRPVDSSEPGQWHVVPWGGYWNRSYGEVVRLVDVEGALGATWRKAVVHQDRKGAVAWDWTGWEALKAKHWEDCVDALTTSLELRPGGDRGRVHQNRPVCLWELGEQDAAMEDLRVGCLMGHQKACERRKRNLMILARKAR